MRASDSNIKLLKVIKNPITQHLPVGVKKLGTSFSSSKLTKPADLVPADEPIVIVIGAMAHGQVMIEMNLLIRQIQDTQEIAKY